MGDRGGDQGFLNVKKYMGRDVIIFPDGSMRRRKLKRWLGSPYEFGELDIADLVEAGAEVVVIGTGIFSWAKLSDEILDYAINRELELVPLA